MSVKMSEFLEDRKRVREAVLRYAFAKMTESMDEADLYDDMNYELCDFKEKYEDTHLTRMCPATWEV